LNEIYCDSADPKSIEELRREGLKVVKAVKGNDSVNAGISKLREYEVYYTRRSKNIKKEIDNYQWLTVGGKPINKPIDDWNHCFVGSTLVETINGQVPIKDIQVGDLVLTSKGYKRVLLKHNNGLKQVSQFLMQFDTFSLSLCCTKTHKVKTEKSWKEIEKLRKGQRLYLSKYFKGRNITYIQTRDTFQKVGIGYIESFGSSIMEKFLKGITFITLMAIHKITKSVILTCFKALYICGLLQKSVLEKTLSFSRIFKLKALKQRRNGISQKKEEFGTQNTAKNVGLIERLRTMFANNVGKSTQQDTQVFPSSVTITAKLKHFEQGISWQEEVYDLTVEDAHEYFANGILVHNCLDSIRYAVYTKYSKKKLLIF
jgi:hypothetical protein